MQPKKELIEAIRNRKYPDLPEVGDIAPGLGYHLVLTSIDRVKDTITAKVFTTFKDAFDWRHDSSLASHPEWHKENCAYCRLEKQALEMENNHADGVTEEL